MNEKGIKIGDKVKVTHKFFMGSPFGVTTGIVTKIEPCEFEIITTPNNITLPFTWDEIESIEIVDL